MGVPYSAAVALQLAVTAPGCVHTLTLIEPPPVQTASRDRFIAANGQLQEDYRRHGSATALNRFLTRLVGPDWRSDIERRIRGAVTQGERDADTFFATDLPALLDWRFGVAKARRIRQPVLTSAEAVAVSGSPSPTPHLDLASQAEDVEVAGADHSLVMTHPAPIASAMASFLRRHPIAV